MIDKTSNKSYTPQMEFQCLKMELTVLNECVLSNGPFDHIMDSQN